MEFTYTVTYLKCQSCSAKNHCDQCSGEVHEALLRQAGVEAAEVDLNQKRLRITGDDEDTLLDALDDCGVFVD